jgi:hypothetical protein
MARSGVVSESLFEVGYLWSEGISGAVGDVDHRVDQLASDATVLCLEVQERHRRSWEVIPLDCLVVA